MYHRSVHFLRAFEMELNRGKFKYIYARKDEKIFNITIRFEQYFSRLYNYSEYYNNKLRKKFYLKLKEKKKRDFETFQSSLIFKSPAYIQQTL